MNFRTYGTPPYTVAVIHGGPGAGGEMAPVARALAPDFNVLEPIQTATTLDGQVEELREVLHTHSDQPITLIGYSWGAWLAYILAARHTDLVRKLILVSSGPFEAHYAQEIGDTRMNRLSAQVQTEFITLLQALRNPDTVDKDASLARLGELVDISDTFAPYDDDLRDKDHVEVSGDVFQSVWTEAASLRASGDLLALASQIQCPVAAIHGDYDPHPAEGVREPLSANLSDFTFHLLEKCGHTPWRERHATHAFYQLLRSELR